MKSPTSPSRKLSKKISLGFFHCTVESDTAPSIKEQASIPQELQHYTALFKFSYETQQGVFKNAVASIDTLLYDWKKLEDLIRNLFNIAASQSVHLTYDDEGKTIMCSNNHDLHVLFAMYKHVDACRTFKELPLQWTCLVKTEIATPVRNWEIQEKLGAGSFGIVYRVFDTDKGRIMACKEIDLSKGSKKAVCKHIFFNYY